MSYSCYISLLSYSLTFRGRLAIFQPEDNPAELRGFNKGISCYTVEYEGLYIVSRLY